MTSNYKTGTYLINNTEAVYSNKCHYRGSIVNNADMLFVNAYYILSRLIN